MPKQFLDRSDVVPGLGQMRREAVPVLEGVSRDSATYRRRSGSTQLSERCFAAAFWLTRHPRAGCCIETDGFCTATTFEPGAYSESMCSKFLNGNLRFLYRNVLTDRELRERLRPLKQAADGSAAVDAQGASKRCLENRIARRPRFSTRSTTFITTNVFDNAAIH